MSEENNIPPEEIPATDDGQTTTPTAPSGPALRAATASLGKSAKEAGQQVKKLFSKILETEQLTLISEEAFEESMLWDTDKIQKKYTAAQAEKIEMRRNACLYMLSRECPVEEIAVILRMNLRTISALAAQHGRKAAAFSEHFAHQLLADAASDIALASTKRGEASYKDLHIGAGIKMQHATALKMVAEVAQPAALDVSAEDEKLNALRKKMMELSPAQIETPNKTEEQK